MLGFQSGLIVGLCLPTVRGVGYEYVVAFINPLIVVIVVDQRQ